MARIFLISLNTETKPYPVYPMGMAVVAGALTEAGHDVVQHDMLASNGGNEVTFEETVNNALSAARDFDSELIGISVRNIDNVDSFVGLEHWQLGNLKALVTTLKEGLGIPVTLGGPGFSIMPESILEYTGADGGVVGRGEEAMVRLCADLLSGKATTKLWRAEGPANETAFPPMLDDALMDFYGDQSGICSVQSKWGCPFKCTYCTYPHIEGPRFHYRDVDRVMDEIRDLHDRYSIHHIVFTDSVFNDPAGRHLELVDRMIDARSQGLDLKWSAYFRPSKIAEAEVGRLKESGLCGVELGTDAGCDTTLKAMKKGFTMSDARQMSERFMEADIPVAQFVIFGGPGETMDTLRESVDNLRSMRATVFFPYVGVRILPGTSLHKLAIEEKVVTPDDKLLKPVFYTPPGIDFDEVNEFLSTEFKTMQNCFYPPSEGELRMDVMRRFGHKGLIWDQLKPTKRRRKNDAA